MGCAPCAHVSPRLIASWLTQCPAVSAHREPSVACMVKASEQNAVACRAVAFQGPTLTPERSGAPQSYRLLHAAYCAGGKVRAVVTSTESGSDRPAKVRRIAVVRPTTTRFRAMST